MGSHNTRQSLGFCLLLISISLMVQAEDQCSACQRVVVNKKNERKCIRKADCCEANGVRLNCVVDPCLNFRRSCPRARHCVSAHCEKLGCQAFYYDGNFLAIQSGDCEVKILRREMIAKAQNRWNVQSEGGQRKTLDFEVPIYNEPHKSEKLGNCPKYQMTEIIKACSDECATDHDCTSRRLSKCCWNGCAKRCSRPFIKDPSSFLNLPLLSNDD
ncbi:Whey acidic protein-type 4-disulfide core domain-containing protein [Aphelenchoides besseyi]|nr:Whey acidic protein-type 4-disulfide core domain-containing protein [Aphelenchoides besseyi]KAI6237699.1 Whey acidic protein-type 4-disulfide core domain-containing protein [Aphelenchoides besseyi]